MAVTFDAAATSIQTFTAAAVVTLTIAANAVLLVGCYTKGTVAGSISAVAQNGTALTQLGRVEGSGGTIVTIFGLTAPSSGVVSISANTVGGVAMEFNIHALTYTGAKASNCFGTPGSATAASAVNLNLSVSSATNNKVVAFFCSPADVTAVPATARAYTGSNYGSGAFEATGAATVSISASVAVSTAIVGLGISIIFSVAAAPSTLYGLMMLGVGA